MRTAVLLLVAIGLLSIVPAVDAAPPSGAYCVLREEYVTGVTVDPTDPGDPVHPGYYTLVECYY